MLKKLLITLIFCLGLGFGFSAQAASGTCPTDDGLGTGAGPGQYYCLGAFRTGQTQCPSWTGTICATGLTCPTNCNGADSCGYCNSCATNYTLCGTYPSQTCTANTDAPANCSSFSQCTKVCSACAQGYELSGNVCNGATLKLGSDSVGAASYLFQSTAPSVSILSDGKVGLGATPLDVFSIGMGGVAAPVGSLGTGHNNTMTYLSTDQYALVNYGTVMTLLNSATATNALWNGTKNGNIWNGDAGVGNVGIGTTNPGQKLEVVGTAQDVTSLRLRNNTWSCNQTDALEFWNGSNKTNPTSRIVSQMDGCSSEGENLQFQTQDAGSDANYPTTKLIIKNTGNVGIGTTVPNGLLQVGNNLTATTLYMDNQSGYGSRTSKAWITYSASDTNQLTMSGGAGLTIHNNDTTDGNWSTLAFSSYEGASGNNVTPAAIRARITNRTVGGWANGDLAFFTSPHAGLLERMRIDTNGNVGIGTTNPKDKLSIGYSSAGSLGTGHNSTMSYSSDDDYALVNYGLLKSATIMASNTTAVVSGGDLNMGGKNILNVNKLTVLTIDPLYNIKGINYSTYAPSISGGVKEECLGKVVLSRRNLNNEYEKIIDFSNEPEGTDLWVWRQVVDFNFDNIEVLLTPYGKFANTYYLIENNKLIFRSDKPITLSYRLIGNRFDWRKWPTKALDQTEKGTMVNLFN